MSRPLQSVHRALWPVLALALALPTSAWAEDDEADAGDVSRLECKLKRLPLSEDSDQVAVVQVTNRGSLTAEPLAFEFRIPGARRSDPTQTIAIRRMPAPNEGRRGRSILPGKRLTYWLPVVVPVKPRKRAQVVVTEASFFEGEGVANVPVRVVKREVIKVKDGLGRPRKQAIHTLENRLETPVDVIVRITYARPKGLSYVRLLQIDAGRRLEWDGDAEPGGLRITEFGKYAESLIKKLDVLDWSVLEGAARKAAREEPVPVPMEVDRSPPQPAPDIPALQAAWDAHYRHPAKPIHLAGRFSIEAADTRDDWRGQSKAGGTFTFQSYTGTPRAGSGLVYAKADISVEGPMGGTPKAAIARLLEARYTIWTRQDPAALPLYERAFAGAALKRDADREGVWRLDSGPWRAVTIRDGGLAALELADGTVRSFSWREAKGAVVVSSVRNRGPGDHASELHVEWATLESARRVPKLVRIENWFEAGWGPETFTFERLRETPAR